MLSSHLRLGHIPVDGPERDAVLIAAVPVIVRERIALGQHIDVMPRVVLCAAGIRADYIGIVDPFMAASAFDGDRICTFLCPYTITGLAHHSTHPAIADTGRGADPGRQRSAERRGNDAQRRTGGVEPTPMAKTDVHTASQVRGIGPVCAVLPAFAHDGTIVHRIDNPHPARRPFLLRRDYARNVARSCARTYSRKRDCDMPIDEMIDARDRKLIAPE